jgi:undecaprenyl-diphosphatase
VGEGLQAVILGIIEGLTEFLPVSSTGHMVIAMPLLGVDPETPQWRVFLYFIQIGAILAVILHFWRRLWAQIVIRPTNGWSSHLATKIVVAALPAAVIGYWLNEMLEKLETPVVVAVTLIAGAAVMVWIERRARTHRVTSISDIDLKQAFLVGLSQCVAAIPGTSRSMATIMGALLLGFAAPVAAEFSFYLAIPTLVGAGLLKLVKYRHDITGQSAAILGLGFAVAFVVALVVISAFMKYIQTRKLWPFAVYRVILGVAVLAWWFTSHHAP